MNKILWLIASIFLFNIVLIKSSAGDKFLTWLLSNYYFINNETAAQKIEAVEGFALLMFKSPYSFILCVKNIIVTLLIRSVQVLFCSMFLLYFMFQILWLRFFGYGSYKLAPWFTRNYMSSTWLNVFIVVFLKKPACFGFVCTYSFFLFLQSKKYPKNYFNLIISFSIWLLFGVSAWVMMYVSRVTKEELKISTGFVWYIRFDLPDIILYSLEYDLDNISNVGEQLVIYKDSFGKLKFNPSPKKKVIAEGTAFFEHSVANVKSKSAKSATKFISHPAIVPHSYDLENPDEKILALQFTGHQLEHMHGFHLETMNYKLPTSFVATNLVQCVANVSTERRLGILANAGINSYERWHELNRITVFSRLQVSKKGIYFEGKLELKKENGLEFYTQKNIHIPNTNYIFGLDKLNNELCKINVAPVHPTKFVRFQDHFINNFDKLSPYDKKLVLYELEKDQIIELNFLKGTWKTPEKIEYLYDKFAMKDKAFVKMVDDYFLGK